MIFEDYANFRRLDHSQDVLMNVPYIINQRQKGKSTKYEKCEQKSILKNDCRAHMEEQFNNGSCF